MTTWFTQEHRHLCLYLCSAGILSPELLLSDAIHLPWSLQEIVLANLPSIAKPHSSLNSNPMVSLTMLWMTRCQVPLSSWLFSEHSGMFINMWMFERMCSLYMRGMLTMHDSFSKTMWIFSNHLKTQRKCLFVTLKCYIKGWWRDGGKNLFWDLEMWRIKAPI